MHQCGRCKQLFYDIDSYFRHKDARSCAKVKVKANITGISQLQNETSATLLTELFPQDSETRAIKDKITSLSPYSDKQKETLVTKAFRIIRLGSQTKQEKTLVGDVDSISSLGQYPVPHAETVVTKAIEETVHDTSDHVSGVSVQSASMDTSENSASNEFSTSFDELIALKEVDEHEKSAVNDAVKKILPLHNHDSSESTNLLDNTSESQKTSVRQSPRGSVPKKSWMKDFSTEVETHEPPKKRRKDELPKRTKKNRETIKREKPDRRTSFESDIAEKTVFSVHKQPMEKTKKSKPKAKKSPAGPLITEGLVAIVPDSHLLEVAQIAENIKGTQCYSCPKCSFNVELEDQLNEHLRIDHNLTMHVCQRCHQGFIYPKSLNQHARNCTGVKTNKKPPKFTHLTNSNQLYFQMNKKMEKHCKRLVIFNCYVCSSHCSDLGDLEKHLKDNHPEIHPAICPYCNHWFSKKQYLIRHLSSSVHDYIDQTELTLSKKSVEDQDQEVVWQQPFKDEVSADEFSMVKFQCTVCWDIFDSKDIYEEHYFIVHGAAERKSYRCETCQVRFKTKGELRKHLKLHDHKSAMFQTCNICVKTFYQDSHWERHIESLHKPTAQMPEDILMENSEQSLNVSQPSERESRSTDDAFPCFVCPVVLNSYQMLCMHMELHRVWVPHPEKGCNPPDLISAFESDACKGIVRKVMAQKLPQGSENECEKAAETVEDLADEQPEQRETQETAENQPESSEKDPEPGEKDPQTFKTLMMSMFDQMNKELQGKGSTKPQEVQVQITGGHQRGSDEVHSAKRTEDMHHKEEDSEEHDDTKECDGYALAKEHKVKEHKPTSHVNEASEPVEIQTSEDDPIIVKSDLFLCCYCFQVFPSEKILYEHKIDFHQLVLQWTCNRTYECEAVFNTMKDYQEHHEKVHPQGSFICLACNDHYHSQSHLFVHKTTSHRYLTDYMECKEAEHKCVLCEKNFISAGALVMHTKAEHRPKVCTSCKKVFHTLADLKQHIVTECSPDHLCDQCGQVFTSKVALGKHRATHDASRSIVCTICRQEFKKREHLRRHQVTKHSDEKPYKCTYEGCDRAFKRRDKLQEHERCHKDNKPFKCSKCGRGYRYKDGLRYHEKSHERGDEHECHLCGLPFPKPGQLKQHLKADHKFEMKRDHIHRCEQCETTFARPERLKRHMEREHDLNPSWEFKCQVCHKGFSGQKSLDSHMKTRHGPKENLMHSAYNPQEMKVSSEPATVIDPAIGQQVPHIPGMDQGLTLTQIDGEFFLVTAEGGRIPLKQIQGQPVQLQGQVPVQESQVQIQNQQIDVTHLQGQGHQVQIQGQQVHIQGQQIQIQGQSQVQLQVQEHPVPAPQAQGQGLVHSVDHVSEQGHHLQESQQSQGQYLHQGQGHESQQNQVRGQHQSQEQIQGHKGQGQENLQGTTIEIHEQPNGEQRLVEVNNQSVSSRSYHQDFVVENNAAQEILVSNQRSQDQSDQNLTLELQQEIQHQINEHIRKEQQQQQQQQQLLVQSHQQFEPSTLHLQQQHQQQPQQQSHQQQQQQQHQQFSQPILQVPSVTPAKVRNEKPRKQKQKKTNTQNPTSATTWQGEIHHDQQIIMAAPPTQQLTPMQLLPNQVSSVSPATIKLPLQMTPTTQSVFVPIQVGQQFIPNQIIQPAPPVVSSNPTPKLSTKPAKVSTTNLAPNIAQSLTLSAQSLQPQQIVIPVSDLSAYQTFQTSNASFAPIMLNLEPGTQDGDAVQQTLQNAGLQTITLHNPGLQQ